MKLGTLMLQLQAVEHKVAVYEELIEFLGKDGLEIPVETGTAPEEAIQAVLTELMDRKGQLEAQLSAAEDVEIEDVELEDLAGGESVD
jgi:hypothetical protein